MILHDISTTFAFNSVFVKRVSVYRPGRLLRSCVLIIFTQKIKLTNTLLIT